MKELFMKNSKPKRLLTTGRFYLHLLQSSRKTEYDAAINNLDMFSDCGFEVEDFGNSTVIVRSSPQYIPAVEIEDCITEMSGYISQGKTDIFTEKMDWFYSNVACRSAIKAGNKSTPEELIGIVNTLKNILKSSIALTADRFALFLQRVKLKNNLAGCDFWKNLLIRFQLSVLPHQAKQNFRLNLQSILTVKSYLPIPCRYTRECRLQQPNLPKKRWTEFLII